MSDLPKTVFATVEECMASLREELPLFKEMLRLARLSHDGKKIKDMKRLIAFLEDTDGLRERLQSLAKPDGSVHFAFTPEAWARFNQYRKTGV